MGNPGLCLLLQYLHIFAVKSCQGRHNGLSREFPQEFCEERLFSSLGGWEGVFNLYPVVNTPIVWREFFALTQRADVPVIEISLCICFTIVPLVCAGLLILSFFMERVNQVNYIS